VASLNLPLIDPSALCPLPSAFVQQNSILFTIIIAVLIVNKSLGSKAVKNMNSSNLARANEDKSNSAVYSFGDLLKKNSSSGSFSFTNEAFQKTATTIETSQVKIPGWYSKKYVSQGELDKAIAAIKEGGIANEAIVARYLKDEKQGYYELIDGLVVLKAHAVLGIEKIECQLIDDRQFSKSKAMLASIGLNSRQSLNPWESTVAGVNFLVEQLELKREEQWIQIPTIGTRERRVITQIDKAVGLCKTLLKIRRAKLNLESGKKIDSDTFEALESNMNSGIEAAINAMLLAINIDLSTFVEKRIKLLELPRNITNALSNGKLHYSKAVSLSRVGMTPSIQALTDRLGDVDVSNSIIKERESLLEHTIEKNLTNKELLEMVHQANNRIFVLGTSEDEGGLSVDEIGERRQCKEDLILQSRAIQDLTKVRSIVKSFDIIDRLTEAEKMTLQKKVKSLFDLADNLKQKASSR
jgi:hypothetical protein